MFTITSSNQLINTLTSSQLDSLLSKFSTPIIIDDLDLLLNDTLNYIINNYQELYICSPETGEIIQTYTLNGNHDYILVD